MNNIKADKTEIPIKVSQLENDENFIDNMVNSLVNYYLKDDVFTKSDINTILTLYALKNEIPTTLPASDVYEWAKQPTKPTYSASEVGALSDTTIIPTKTSDLTNDSNFTTNTYVDNAIGGAMNDSY